MKKFIVLFREPDGRKIQHTDDEVQRHQTNWRSWLSNWGQKGNLNGGSGLTLEGRLVSGSGEVVINDIHRSGTEIVGGYLLLNAIDIDEATEIMKTCPIYEFDGYAEIRELQVQS
jgi:hypothetical protein